MCYDGMENVLLKSPIAMLLSSRLFVPVGRTRVSILMLRNINKPQDVDACLDFLALKRPLAQFGTCYKPNQVAYLIRLTIASQ